MRWHKRSPNPTWSWRPRFLCIAPARSFRRAFPSLPPTPGTYITTPSAYPLHTQLDSRTHSNTHSTYPVPMAHTHALTDTHSTPCVHRIGGGYGGGGAAEATKLLWWRLNWRVVGCARARARAHTHTHRHTHTCTHARTHARAHTHTHNTHTHTHTHHSRLPATTFTGCCVSDSVFVSMKIEPLSCSLPM